ncbi:MAG: efflux RND transporter permease subunit [Candidatus Moraniibacteriota bacterium]|nr:MAG: efflux RND transporter permease subunit [Candidatus Moranbacteria bacterium]
MNNKEEKVNLNENSLSLAGKLTQIFLKNGKISALTLLILALWGGLSFFLMPKQYNPEIVAPAFTIITDFPGFSAQETHKLLTRHIEDSLANLPNLETISSQSFAGGKSIVLVQFIVGSSQEEAILKLSQKLKDTQISRPLGASEPYIEVIDPENVPILDIGLSSTTLSETSLRKIAIEISDELKHTPGISKTEIKGGYVNQLQIELNGSALASKNISLTQVLNTLSQANGSFAISAIESGEKNSIVSISSSIRGIEDLSKIILKTENNTFLRLEDVADISYNPGEITHFVHLSEKDKASVPVVHIALSKGKGENATTVSQNTLTRLEELKENIISKDVNVFVLRDEGHTASEEIFKLSFDLIKSIIIVAVLLFLFLGFRNALITSISIPLVLLVVFGIGLLAGQTINRITLFALILSLGLLVDDAIVVMENIARYFRLYPKENKIKLIVRAVNEVGGALTLSTVTMALAFFPMAFVTGMMGPYMGPIPFFVPVALFASLLLSVTLNPFLALILLPKTENPETKKVTLFSKLLEKIELFYVRTLSHLLQNTKKQKITLGLTLLFLIAVLILPFTSLLPFRMLPKADKEQFYIYLDLPDETTINITQKTTQALEESLLKESEILSVESFIGTSQVIDFNGLFKGSSGRIYENQATLKINLTPPHTRKDTSETIAFRIRNNFNPLKKEYPNATLRIIEDPPGPPVLSTFLLKIKGEDDTIREAIARDLFGKITQIDGIVDQDTSIPERGIYNTYRIQYEKAQLLGINPKDITQALQVAFSGSSIGFYHETDQDIFKKAEQENIIIRFAEEYRNENQDLNLIKLQSKSGEIISLTEVLEKTNEPLEKTILSDDRIKTTFISAEMGDRSIVYAVLDLFPELLHYELPTKNGKVISWSPLQVTYEDQITHKQYQIEIDGEWKLTIQVFRDLGIVMGLVLFLIFFVLATRTQSLLIPILIMTSIPLGLLGILPGFAFLHFFKGTYFNATSMIGVIALSGLSVKNAIIFLEYLEPMKHAGKTLQEALVETGRIRLLPILLTSLTAIFGSFTIVSDPVWEGLAWALIFGLSASTFLTLIIFPLLYFIFQRKYWK